MDELNNSQPADAEVYPLDDAAIEMIADLERNIQATLLQENAVLTYFLKQHKLGGNWILKREGEGALREIVKQRAAAPVMMPTPQ